MRSGVARVPDQIPLYPSEDEIARAVLGDQAKDWPALARALEPHGLPKPHAFTNRRYWPAVKAFFDDLNNRGTQSPAPIPGDMEKPLCPTTQPVTRPALNGGRGKPARRCLTGARTGTM